MKPFFARFFAPLAALALIFFTSCAAQNTAQSAPPAESASFESATPSAAGPAAENAPSESLPPQRPALPDGFCYVVDVIPGLAEEMRYATADNFMGRAIAGYNAPYAVLSNEAAAALAAANADFEQQGFAVKLFDAYRPQMAVDDIMQWLEDDADQKMKTVYYPNVEKSRLFAEQYLASRSGHTRGATVDMTLVDLATGEEADMGTGFDFFDPASHYAAPGLTEEQAANRMLLRETMLAHGFYPYDNEWWHFTLEDEPYPDTYFTFEVG